MSKLENLKFASDSIKKDEKMIKKALESCIESESCSQCRKPVKFSGLMCDACAKSFIESHSKPCPKCGKINFILDGHDQCTDCLSHVIINHPINKEFY